jgi:hypothetical protein
MVLGPIDMRRGLSPDCSEAGTGHQGSPWLWVPRYWVLELVPNRQPSHMLVGIWIGEHLPLANTYIYFFLNAVLSLCSPCVCRWLLTRMLPNRGLAKSVWFNQWKSLLYTWGLPQDPRSFSVILSREGPQCSPYSSPFPINWVPRLLNSWSVNEVGKVISGGQVPFTLIAI